MSLSRLINFLVLLLASAARADITTGFEPPLVTGSPAGVLLPGQDGWYNPVPGTGDYRAYTHAGDAFNFPNHPQGGNQFIAARSLGGLLVARAEHAENFVGADVWSLSVDVACKFLGPPPGINPIGGFSLEDSTVARSFTGLMTWTNPAAPGSWQLGYMVFDATGVPVPHPGLFAGPQWQGLTANRWYRVTTTWSFSQNRILTVSIRDLLTGVATTTHPPDWYLTGGAAPVLPIPTALRLTTDGNIAGNTVGWDNLFSCAPRIDNINPPFGQQGAPIQIHGCGFGDNADDLSVAMVMPDGTGIPFTVVSATNSMILATVGPVPPDAVAGPIAVVRGLGQRGINTPALDDVIPENPPATLVWDRAGHRALSALPFNPIITGPPPGETWLCGRRIAGGMMELTVSSDWQPNTSLHIYTKLHETVLGIGDDVEAVEIRLRCGGDAQYLAERISDAVVTAYATRGINTTCSVFNTGVNTWAITLTLLDANQLVVPIDFGVFTVVATNPSLVSPFAIGPVTGFYQSTLTQPGTAAQVNNVDETGQDGATISPIIPTPVGILARTDPIDLDVPGESFTLRSWGTLNGVVANQLVHTARLTSTGTGMSMTSDASPIGAGQVRVEVWNNTMMVGTVNVPNGPVGQVAPGIAGRPIIIGGGARPSLGPADPYLWINLDRAATITPTGGLPLTGNQVRLFAVTPADTVTDLRALDLAAGLVDPGDISMFVIFNSYEGGICYANCDGSSGSPRLTANDFQCFINAFASGVAGANCDGSTGTPALTSNDFQCFINQFAGGCP